jgi:hypothetical protein
MASRSHREIAITLALLAMANCAGPDAPPREPVPLRRRDSDPPKHGTHLGIPWEKQLQYTDGVEASCDALAAFLLISYNHGNPT